MHTTITTSPGCKGRMQKCSIWTSPSFFPTRPTPPFGQSKFNWEIWLSINFSPVVLGILRGFLISSWKTKLLRSSICFYDVQLQTFNQRNYFHKSKCTPIPRTWKRHFSFDHQDHLDHSGVDDLDHDGVDVDDAGQGGDWAWLPNKHRFQRKSWRRVQKKLPWLSIRQVFTSGYACELGSSD